MTRWIGLRRMVIVIALAGAVIYAFQHRASPPAVALPVLVDGIAYQSSQWTADDWRREGYVEMVSPIRPPSSDDGRIRIAVYIRMPPGSRMRTRRGEGAETLEVPVGTRADRVEFQGDGSRDAIPSSTWRVLDVRGISFAPSQHEFRVLRPKVTGGHELFGIRWPRGEERAATAALGELVLGGFVAGPMRLAERERAAAHLRGLNDCPSCHTPDRRGRQTERDPGVVNRGADASGLFQVASILRDRLPFETYRPRDSNRGDPYITRMCGGAPVEDSLDRCPGGAILEGELNVRAAMKNEDPHAQRVCASRRALAQYWDDDGRSAFREALAECEEGPGAR